MPLETMASAVSRISCSLTSQPKWFQLFQPIGGVRARPLSRERPAQRARPATVKLRGARFISVPHFVWCAGSGGTGLELSQKLEHEAHELPTRRRQDAKRKKCCTSLDSAPLRWHWQSRNQASNTTLQQVTP